MADAEVEEPEQGQEVEAGAEEPGVEEEEEEDEDFVAVGGGAATEIKLFGKWSFDDIEVRDISLVVRSVVVW